MCQFVRFRAHCPATTMDPMPPLPFSEDTLRLHAGDVLFHRGLHYAEQGRVALVSAGSRSAVAMVMGTQEYTVRLSVATGRLTGSCICPFAEVQPICKHIVAATLLWLQDSDPSAAEPAAETAPQAPDLREFLLAQDRVWLADQLLAVTQDDPTLHAQLLIAAGADPEDSVDEDAVRRQLLSSLDTGGFVSYYEAHDFFTGIEEVLDGVEELLELGASQAAARLALLALDGFEELLPGVDDSDGGLSIVSARAEEIHLRATQASPGDSRELAQDLARRALTSDLDVFRDAAEQYRDLLGPEGLEQFRDAVEERWRSLSDDDRAHRYQVAAQRRRIAEAIGGTDGLVALLRAELDTDSDAAALIDVLLDAQRIDDAVLEARALLERFGDSARFRAVAAEAFARAGRHDEAAELSWTNFAEQPFLRTFQSLKLRSGPAFAHWREQALTILQEQAGEHGTWPSFVDVLLWDEDMPRAWETAAEHGARDSAWLTLARWRASGDGAEAARVLYDLARASIAGGQRSAYAEAAQLLTEAQGYVGGADAKALTAQIRDLRAQNRRRPALQDEFSKAGLPG